MVVDDDRAGRVVCAIEARAPSFHAVVVAHAAQPLARLGGGLCVWVLLLQAQGKLDEAGSLALRALAMSERGAPHSSKVRW